MGRVYAGILGPLACTVVIVRGIVSGGGVTQTLGMASLALFGFALLGWMTGNLAQHLVTESVRSQFQKALQETTSQESTR
ncbi:MAG: hypothetical protein U0894_06540 [Pirellulales bacterium]